MTTVTSKGQITIPKKVRDALGLTPGSQLDFEIVEGRAIIHKRVPHEALDRWQGFLSDKAGTNQTDQIMAELRGEE